ncbi:MAG: HU family DNA-binding protein [Bacteroides sp.]|nr:HU family DNA-binding protein [Bacteroides sp.]
MPLLYKAYRSSLKNKEGKHLHYPRLVKTGKIVTTQKLGELIADKSAVTPGDVHNVVRNLTSVMREQLLNGRSVRLDGLGTFTLVIHANGKGVENAEDVSSNQITRLECRFTPEYTRSAGNQTTRALLEGVEYVKLTELTGKSNAASNDDEGDPDPDDNGNGGNDGGFIDPAA